MKNNLTLVVDGNWLVMMRMFTVKSILQEDPDRGYEILGKGLLQSINYILQEFPDIDNWVLVSDGGSWRKKIEIPESLKEITYKGNRKKTDDFDWDRFFNFWNDFQETLKSQGVVVSHAPQVEGDDWAWYWTNKLNSEGISCIVWTKDCDLKQLVSYSNSTWTGWYNQSNGLWLDESANHDFEALQTSSSRILDRVKSIAAKVVYFNPKQEIVLNKILQGDTADNIKPIFRKTKNGRTYKLGKNELPQYFDIYNENKIDAFINNILISEKWKNENLNKDIIKEHFIYNRKLVTLDKREFPNNIISTIEKYAPEYTKSNFDVVYKPVKKDSIDNLIDLI
jgi:5'-3' exonuclease